MIYLEDLKKISPICGPKSIDLKTLLKTVCFVRLFNAIEKVLIHFFHEFSDIPCVHP